MAKWWSANLPKWEEIWLMNISPPHANHMTILISCFSPSTELLVCLLFNFYYFGFTLAFKTTLLNLFWPVFHVIILCLWKKICTESWILTDLCWGTDILKSSKCLVLFFYVHKGRNPTLLQLFIVFIGCCKEEGVANRGKECLRRKCPKSMPLWAKRKQKNPN